MKKNHAENDGGFTWQEKQLVSLMSLDFASICTKDGKTEPHFLPNAFLNFLFPRKLLKNLKMHSFIGTLKKQSSKKINKFFENSINTDTHCKT